MHAIYDLKETLCKELEEYGSRGELTAGTLDVVDKLAHTIKNLDKIIETIRQRSIMDDRISTLTAQGKFESIVMACAPLMAFVILYVLDRHLMEPLVTTVLGWAAIGVVLLLELIGYVIIKKIVTVEI